MTKRAWTTGKTGGPLLLTAGTVPTPTSGYLTSVKAGVSTGHVFGGTSVVPAAVQQALLTLLAH